MFPFCFKQFLNLAGRWAYLKNSAIVRLFGITLAGQISMVMDYGELGPLDQYLRTHKSIVRIEDLVEASANLASALWHLVRLIVCFCLLNHCVFRRLNMELYTEKSAVENCWFLSTVKIILL